MSWYVILKKQGKHPEKSLTALKVKNLSDPGRYSDGNGLYLVVDPSGAKRWLLRTVIQGKRTDIGLGGLSLVSLAEARESALSYRRVARQGGDPLAEKRAKTRVVPTFKVAAETVHAEHKATWKNEKHAQQWINTLTQYAFPQIGNLTVDRLETPDVLRVLAPIWLTKPETARRVRQRIGSVLDWAKAAGYRAGDNPVEGVTRGLPKQAAKEDHHAAMPYKDVPTFISALKKSNSSLPARLAFEFLILTASRTSEVLQARWSEINTAEGFWTIPATRMKAKREHRVPLSPRAKDILAEARQVAGTSEFLFPGRTIEKPMSNMVFLKILERMEVKVTAHGFRSSFRDWAAETTSYPRELAEMALAHTIENKVEAAYRRGDLLERRRELMMDWASYVAG
ncbi:tyrosine-type recombinase/integrase [Rhizobium cremeum]|uniref:tyrosine-type recombinase/integrase n=1 Tax=Rhizobium cremeum TaxID=2813827 RepID=UPI001FD3AF66|nr:site-specific integrase [Rhizobium cremeum]